MKINTTIALLSGCLIMQSANATFNAQDPRALGMGGVGTASANSAQAHFYNPSLLVNAKANEDFNFEIYGTARLADPDNLIDNVNDFATNKYIEDFNTAFINIDAAIRNDSIPTSFNELQADLVAASEKLRTGINNLSNKALIGSGNVGAMTSVPGSDFGWAAYYNLWGDAGIKLVIDPADNQLVGSFIDSINSLTLSSGSIVLPDNPVNGLLSSVDANIMWVNEFGISLAIPYQLNNYSFDIGITPKLMSVNILSYTQTLQQFENDLEVFDFNDPEKYNSFNMDFGLSKTLNENWKSGLFIKNIIPQSYKSSTNNKIKIDPEFRIGTSYQNNWVVVGLDIDLTENNAPASGAKSRYVAIGAELDLWIAKLRAGYRANLAASNNNVTTLGLGFNLFALNLDLAAGFGQGNTGTNDANLSAQLGLQW